MSRETASAAMSSLGVFTHRRPDAPPGWVREMKAGASAHLLAIFRRGASEDRISHCIAALGVLASPSAPSNARRAAMSVLRAHFESQNDSEKTLQDAREQIRTLSARIAELELKAGLR